ncbi:hypothetical protein I4U23_007971 [Adineta vaga]|nr:hypothetical protein I4U23_007971 [Adineta vaga]
MIFILISFFLCCHTSFGQHLSHNRSFPFIHETLGTQSVGTDPDDPAIWIHPNRSELSLIIGTDKTAMIGGLYVFNLNGTIVQHISNIDRPNNVDVEYGFRINTTHSIDLVVLTERIQKRLRIFSINMPTRQLYEIPVSNPHVFTDSSDEQAAPMGIGLYKRSNDGKIYAIVSRKSGPSRGYLGQYELVWSGQSIDLKFIRYFGDFQGLEIESVVVDDQLGFVYYSDEGYGIRKYNVDPSTNHIEQVGFINVTNLWQGDSEGLAVYKTSNTDGYLIITDQLANGSIFHFYERQGKNTYVMCISCNE